MPYYFRYNHPFKILVLKICTIIGGAKTYFRPPPLFILGGAAPPRPPALYASDLCHACVMHYTHTSDLLVRGVIPILYTTCISVMFLK